MPESSLAFTTGNEVPSEKDALEKSKHWEPTPKEQERMKDVMSRVEQEMLPAQQTYHQEWDDAKEIFEAYVTADPNRPKFRIPISHTVIDAALSEEIDAFPDIEIDTQEDDDKPKIPVLNSAKKYALDQTNWESVKIDARRISRIYGFCPVRVYYARETRKIEERIPVKGDDGIYGVAYRETYDYPVDDIIFEVIDQPRRFLIDDTVRDIDKAIDCALTTEMSWSAFKMKVQHDKRYKNVQFVQPGVYYSTNMVTGEITCPEADLSQVSSHKKVKVLEYWNKADYRYCMIANGVLIRDVPLVDDHGQLPFAVIHMYRRPHVFYSKGIPKILESVESAYNAVLAAEVQATKLAFPILVTSDDAGIDPRSIAPYPGIVLEGAMNKMSLESLGQVPQEAYKLKDKLEQWAIWITGINFQQIFSEKQSDRVGIEALKKESMLSRVNGNLRENEANFIVRLGNLLIQDIMQYYSAPRVRRLMSGEDAANMKDMRFDRDGKQLLKEGDEVRGVLERRKIPVQGVAMEETQDENGTMSLLAKRIEGSSYILARPEYIRAKAKLDVRAVRPSAMGSSKEAKKLMAMELSNHALDVNAAMMQMGGGMTPEGQPIPGKPIWNQDEIEKMVAETNELKVNKVILSEGDQGKQRQAQAELEKIAGPLMQTFKQPVKFQTEQNIGPQSSVPPEQQAQFDFNAQG